MAVEHVRHHFDEDDVVAIPPFVSLPYPFGGRTREGGDAAVTLDQLFAHLREQLALEGPPLIVAERKQDLDEMHDRTTPGLPSGSAPSYGRPFPGGPLNRG